MAVGAIKPQHDVVLIYLLHSSEEAGVNYRTSTTPRRRRVTTKWQEFRKCGFTLPPLGEQYRLVDLLSAADEATESHAMVVSAGQDFQCAILDEHVALGDG